MAYSKGKIYKYDLYGNFISEYESLQQAADLNNIHNSGHLRDHINRKFSFCKKNIYTDEFYIKLPNEFLEHKSKRIYKTKSVHQYNLNGDYIKSFKSRKEVVQLTNIGWRNLTDYLSGNSKSKSVGGFMWSYEKVKKLPKYEKKKNYKQIHQYSKNGKFLKTYNSLKEAAKELNISSSSISHCARGNKRFPTYAGFIWKYEKLKKVTPVKPRKRQIKVYKNNKLFKTYESISQVHKELNLSKTKIWKCLTNKIKSYNGYILKYKDSV